MSWLGTNDASVPRGFGGGADYPWWAAEEEPPTNRTTRCQGHMPEYQAVTSVICAMFLVFGVVYSLFGYRCFKAVMFLTGFLFASVVVYLICVSEALLPVLGNAGVSLGAGVLFGLITMLVQYVGLFMTGFHTGLFLGVALVAGAYPWWVPPSVWAVVGLLLTSGLVMAVLTLYFQKGLTIIGTAVSGGAIMAATLDYFVEELLMVEWFGDRLMGVESDRPCWFSWVVVGVWPFMVVVGGFTQWGVSGKGIHHQQMVSAVRSRSTNVHRLRTREARAELRQKKYRYLYQVRTAHGDIISQEYIQSLQRKAYPACDNGTFQSDSTHTTMLPPDQSQLAPLTESEDEGVIPHVYYPSHEEELIMRMSSAGAPCPHHPPYTPSDNSPTTSGLQQRDYTFQSPPLQSTPPPSPTSP